MDGGHWTDVKLEMCQRAFEITFGVINLESFWSLKLFTELKGKCVLGLSFWFEKDKFEAVFVELCDAAH